MNTVHDQLGRKLSTVRISVTNRCNFRCHYCMPPDIKYHFCNKKSLMSFDEIIYLVKTLVNMGVHKLKLTGGEPLLRPNLAELIAKLQSIDGLADISLITNGYLLSKLASELYAAGLRRITISIDAIDDGLYRQMNGLNIPIDKVLAGIEAVKIAGFTEIKLNAVIQKGVNHQQILPLIRFTRSQGLTMRFIEFMDVGTQNNWDMSKVYSEEQILKDIAEEFEFAPHPANRGSDTAKRFEFKDGQGEFGIISSVSNPFCKRCDRLRVSAEGEFFTCLFATHGLKLLPTLREHPEEIEELIRSLWKARTDAYSEHRIQWIRKNPVKSRIEMFKIGG
ncbi:GTP 3',8-cyclase MoaA [Legionella jamestowniensis]|uniref:GTP 3',8-cyclase n=1 Tax=Legionella jamestowniensis TaxID=455 RepID=A0A0W0UKB9_9GAMM|nr:GTP 3',8-cyclase MoaA [Legionella jamestowniensis]KTD08188.1 Cyclic pyranopterin monophosphate synthase [Legionella jamestowniensis]OCH98511.1 hypothetical protein A8135_00265 [Legionella jamestowniensis]SFL98721.1 cyclic pyranopterin phosphate synthase [Legionella jamestowniensis DSM 19215]